MSRTAVSPTAAPDIGHPEQWEPCSAPEAIAVRRECSAWQSAERHPDWRDDIETTTAVVETAFGRRRYLRVVWPDNACQIWRGR